MMQQILMILASLMGAAGVVLAALGAHWGASLNSAAYMLLFHAPMVFIVVVAARQGLLGRRFADLAAMGFALGGLLFAGDITLRSFLGHGLFPMAAPTGGFVLIGSWLVLAGAALSAPPRSQ